MNLESLFRSILKPALGCTEAVAVALASAAAVQASAGWTPQSAGIPLHDLPGSAVRQLRMRVSRAIFKNAFAVLIPNAQGHKGIVMAAALGSFCNPRHGMDLFRDLEAGRVSAAAALVQAGCIQVSIAETAPSDLYIEVEADLAIGQGACTIRGEHANFACLKRDGVVIHGSSDSAEGESEYTPEALMLKSMTLSEIFDLAEDLPESVLEILRETVERNVSACKTGLSRPLGIGTGFFGAIGGTSTNYPQYLSSLTAAGSDARMAGQAVEIMTSAGSGNQGIVASIPIVAYARMNLIEEAQMLRALALSNLVTMYITTHVGYLSALCGVAIKAGIGAACGVTYAMGGGKPEVECAIKIMAATLTGMICDGAKAGCALKASSAADMATRAAALAMRHADVSDDNGIVAPTAEQTIRNLADLSRSMDTVDSKIIEIMLNKIGS